MEKIEMNHQMKKRIITMIRTAKIEINQEILKSTQRIRNHMETMITNQNIYHMVKITTTNPKIAVVIVSV